MTVVASIFFAICVIFSTLVLTPNQEKEPDGDAIIAQNIEVSLYSLSEACTLRIAC